MNSRTPLIDQEDPVDGDVDQAEIEARATKLGWHPKEQYTGNPNLWKSAQEYLDYADGVLPVLKKNNEKLFGDLRQRDDVIRGLQEKVSEQGKILKTLNEAAADQQTAATNDKLGELRARLVEANREGDPEAIADLQEKIMDLKIEIKAAKVGATEIDPTKPDSRQPAMSADDKAVWDGWLEDNQWYNDPVMAAAATAIGSKIIAEAQSNGDAIPKGRVLLDKVAKMVDDRFHVTKGKSGDKVDGGSTTSSSTATKGGKRYNSLPTAAKEACEAQAKKFVGKGKRYEKLEDWQKRFTEIYYSDEA